MNSQIVRLLSPGEWPPTSGGPFPISVMQTVCTEGPGQSPDISPQVLFCFSNLGSWPQFLLREMVTLDVWALSVYIFKDPLVLLYK